MSQSYNPALPTDRDRVRFLTGDTRTPDDALLEDEEIDWLLSVEPNAWYAAAAAVSQIARKCSNPEEARMAGDTFRWNGSPESVAKEMERLREEGARQLETTFKAFRVL